MNNNIFQLSLPYADFLSKYEWDVWGTFTTPYTMSLPSAERQVKRFETNIKKQFPDYRIFWVAEAFEHKGYHIHLLGSFQLNSMTFSEKRAKLQKLWDMAAASKKRTASSIVKHKKNGEAIKYILKNIQKGKIGYGVLGNAWSIE